MVDGSGACAKVEARAQSSDEVGLRIPHRPLQVEALREAAGDGTREGAARAVRVGRCDAHPGKPDGGAVGKDQQVVGGARGVAALEEDGSGHKRLDARGQPLDVRAPARHPDAAPASEAGGELDGLGDVGRHERGQPEELAHDGLDRLRARERGARRGVTYQRYVPCEACEGRGSVHVDHAKTCPTCDGSGHISVDLGSIFGIGVMSMVCPECEGTGRVVADPCDVCGGTGRVLSASEVVVDIPAGSHDGDTVRVSGMGNAGTNGSTSGDFVCRVGVPSERLQPRAAQGFQMIGFGLPFVLVGLMLDALAQLALIVAVPVLIGLWLVGSSGGCSTMAAPGGETPGATW